MSRVWVAPRDLLLFPVPWRTQTSSSTRELLLEQSHFPCTAIPAKSISVLDSMGLLLSHWTRATYSRLTNGCSFPAKP